MLRAALLFFAPLRLCVHFLLDPATASTSGLPLAPFATVLGAALLFFAPLRLCVHFLMDPATASTSGLPLAPFTTVLGAALQLFALIPQKLGFKDCSLQAVGVYFKQQPLEKAR